MLPDLAEGFRDGLGGENSMLTPNRAAISFATSIPKPQYVPSGSQNDKGL